MVTNYKPISHFIYSKIPTFWRPLPAPLLFPDDVSRKSLCNFFFIFSEVLLKVKQNYTVIILISTLVNTANRKWKHSNKHYLRILSVCVNLGIRHAMRMCHIVEMGIGLYVK